MHGVVGKASSLGFRVSVPGREVVSTCGGSHVQQSGWSCAENVVKVDFRIRRLINSKTEEP